MTTTTAFRAVLAAAVGIAALGTAAALRAQQLSAAQSSITFEVKQMGVPVEGRFGAFDAKLVFDPKKPEAGSVQLSVDLASAQIGDAETTRELAKPEWFDTKKHGVAVFASKTFRPQAGDKIDVAGTLSLKGRARDLTVPVVLSRAGAVTTASGQFTLGRSDFKIGEGEWADVSIVANDVRVRFKLAFTGIAPP